MRYDEVAPYMGDPEQCHDCGALVLSRDLHDRFHDVLAQQVARINAFERARKHDRDDDFPRGGS